MYSIPYIKIKISSSWLIEYKLTQCWNCFYVWSFINKQLGKENKALSCPLWLLYRGTANQSANQRKKAETSKAQVRCIFSVIQPLPRQPPQQPKIQSAYRARFVIKHYDSIHYACCQKIHIIRGSPVLQIKEYACWKLQIRHKLRK